MGGRQIDLAKDFRDLLHAFAARNVRFLIVGAYALAVLGRPRATGDLNVWMTDRRLWGFAFLGLVAAGAGCR